MYIVPSKFQAILFEMKILLDLNKAAFSIMFASEVILNIVRVH